MLLQVSKSVPFIVHDIHWFQAIVHDIIFFSTRYAQWHGKFYLKVLPCSARAALRRVRGAEAGGKVAGPPWPSPPIGEFWCQAQIYLIGETDLHEAFIQLLPIYQDLVNLVV